MKILVLTQDIGKTAPGIVFERLLYGLSQNPDVSLDIIVSNYEPSEEIKANNVQLIKYPRLPGRLSKWIVALGHTDVISHFLKKRIKIQESQYDIFLSLVSFHHYFGLIAGSYLKKKYKAKWACYLVDAIPAPGGWLPEDTYFKSVKNMIGKYLPDVDMLGSVSAEMLAYQLSLFVAKNTIVKDVIFPPSEKCKIVNYKEVDTDSTKRFVYTGNIYGLRRSKYLIEAFSLLYNENKNVELVFVGNCKSVECELIKYNEEIRNKIHLYPCTKDLAPYIEKATALVDIDADIENDVFLSSKMSGYLTCNRPIICETGKNSPSRHIFSGVPSIIQCSHNPEELKNAMLYVIENYRQFDYGDRKRFLNQFSLQIVSQKLYERLNETILVK